jgi:hypothetical protein
MTEATGGRRTETVTGGRRTETEAEIGAATGPDHLVVTTETETDGVLGPDHLVVTETGTGHVQGRVTMPVANGKRAGGEMMLQLLLAAVVVQVVVVYRTVRNTTSTCWVGWVVVVCVCVCVGGVMETKVHSCSSLEVYHTPPPPPPVVWAERV